MLAEDSASVRMLRQKDQIVLFLVRIDGCDQSRLGSIVKTTDTKCLSLQDIKLGH
jgi:hypothetical protein